MTDVVVTAERFYFLHSWVELVADFGKMVEAARAVPEVAPVSSLLLRAFWLGMRTQFEPSDELEADFHSLIQDAEQVGGLPLRVARAGFGMLESERSNFEQCVRWMELAEATPGMPNSLVDLHIGAFKGWALVQLGLPDEARTVFTHYLAQATERRDGVCRAYLLSKLGTAEDDLGDHASAAERHHEGREIFVKAGDRGGQGYTLSRLSWTHYLMGNYELALRYALDGLGHFEASNLRWGVAISHARAGLAEVALGRTTESKARFLETIRLAREIGSPDATHYGVIGLGLALVADGRNREAARLLLGSLAAERNPYRRFAEEGMDVIRDSGTVDDLEAVGAAAATLTLDELADEAVRLAHRPQAPG